MTHIFAIEPRFCGCASKDVMQDCDFIRDTGAISHDLIARL